MSNQRRAYASAEVISARRNSDAGGGREISLNPVARRCPICMQPTDYDTAFCSERHRSEFAEKVRRAADQQRIDLRKGRLSSERPGPYKASTTGARYKRKQREERTAT